MNNELQSTLDKIKIGVDFAIRKYNKTGEIIFIDLSISELTKISVKTVNSKRTDTDDFLFCLNGMIDELISIKDKHSNIMHIEKEEK